MDFVDLVKRFPTSIWSLRSASIALRKEIASHPIAPRKDRSKSYVENDENWVFTFLR